jgi:hypothetical protein
MWVGSPNHGGAENAVMAPGKSWNRGRESSVNRGKGLAGIEYGCRAEKLGEDDKLGLKNSKPLVETLQ